MNCVTEKRGEGVSLIMLADLVQNRWWIETPSGDKDIETCFAIDIKNVSYGWVRIGDKVRDWQPWPSEAESTPQPTDKHKRGISVNCWSRQGEKVTLLGNSFSHVMFAQNLYYHCAVRPEFSEDQVPVVKIKSTTPLTIGKGIVQSVNFEVLHFMLRPS